MLFRHFITASLDIIFHIPFSHFFFNKYRKLHFIAITAGRFQSCSSYIDKDKISIWKKEMENFSIYHICLPHIYWWEINFYTARKYEGKLMSLVVIFSLLNYIFCLRLYMNWILHKWDFIELQYLFFFNNSVWMKI